MRSRTGGVRFLRYVSRYAWLALLLILLFFLLTVSAFNTLNQAFPQGHFENRRQLERYNEVIRYWMTVPLPSDPGHPLIDRKLGRPSENQIRRTLRQIGTHVKSPDELEAWNLLLMCFETSMHLANRIGPARQGGHSPQKTGTNGPLAQGERTPNGPRQAVIAQEMGPQDQRRKEAEEIFQRFLISERTRGTKLCLICAMRSSQAVPFPGIIQQNKLYIQYRALLLILLISTIITLIAIISFPRQVAGPLERLRREFQSYKPGASPRWVEPTGIQEIDDLQATYVGMVETLNEGLRLNERYVTAISQVWAAFKALPQFDPRDEQSSGKIGESLTVLLNLLGSHVPNLHMARIAHQSQGFLCPLCPDFVSEDFRFTPDFGSYRQTTPPDRKIPLGEGVIGWAYDKHLNTEWEKAHISHSSQLNLESVPISIQPDTWKFEHGLKGAVLCLHLRMPPSVNAPLGNEGCLFLFFGGVVCPLTGPDSLFIIILAQQINAYFEMAALLTARQRQNELGHQLSIARGIQRNTLPTKLPQIPGILIDAVIRMADQVGGDYLDFFPFEDGRLGIAVADVAGKNIPAALLTMVLKTTFKALRTEYLSPSQFLWEANRILTGIIAEDYFVTMVFAILDPTRKSVTLGNAGHTPVLLRKAKVMEKPIVDIEIPGYPLGVIATDFKEFSFSVGEGDELLFTTDGVIDVQAEDGERFGNSRLHAFMARDAGTSRARNLMTDLDTFRGTRAPPDDITIVSAKFTTANENQAMGENTVGVL